MDNQPLVPPTPGMFPTSSPSRSSGSPIMLILVIILGLGAIIFGALTVMFASQATTANNELKNKVATAAKVAANTQKKEDEKIYAQENETPFQQYRAPDADGSFILKFPKDWSYTVDQETSGNLLTVVMNPINLTTINSQANPYAAQVQLVQQNASDFMQTYQNDVQGGNLTQTSVTVSGLSGYNLTGTFEDGVTVRMVVIPVRDQVLVFSTQNSDYATEFNELLAQCHINP